MLSAITALLSALPEIISVIKSLMAWIQQAESAAERKALLSKFSAAVDTATQTGNTSSLENLFKTGGQ